MQFSTLTQAAFLLWTSAVQAQTKLGWNHASVKLDNELISENYPDVDIRLLSPAFTNPENVPEGFANGTSGPTDDTTLAQFVRGIASRNDWIHYHTADFQSEEGRPYPYVVLTTDRKASKGPRSKNKLRVYIQGAIHGNEPAGDEGILAMLGKMDANQTWTASLLDKMDIMILPRYNSDGVAYFQRELATNIDPNRDHTKLMRQQTRDIKKLVLSWNPHLVVDMHEYTASRVYGGIYRHGQDALISSGRNLNTHVAIRNMTENLFILGVGARLEAKKFRWNPYVTGATSKVEGSPIVFEEAVTSPTSGRNAYGLTQAIAILVEIRGIRLANQHFQRRVAAALTMLESILDIAAENVDNVLSTVEDSIEDFINSDEDIVLTDYQKSTRRTFTMVNIRNGSIVEVPVEFLSSSPATANLTRARPEAYLIPRNRADIAEKLSVQGLEVETLPNGYRGKVQAYTIASSKLENKFYEGVVRNHVTTKPVEKDLQLVPGSFKVSTRQKNAGLAFICLEPEVAESFVTFGIIHARVGDEYPVFRVMG